MDWATAIGLAGPALFGIVFLVKYAYWVGLWKEKSENQTTWKKLEAQLNSLRETVSDGFERISKRLDKFQESLDAIRQNYVSKDECVRRHDEMEKRLKNLEDKNES